MGNPDHDPDNHRGPLKTASSPREGGWARFLGPALPAVASMAVVASSWRKWPEPLVDFGRELYLPWRISRGAVLYRDVDDFYGPLSQYLNAGLFRMFGPGLMVLATANLVVAAAVLFLAYVLFRRAWGEIAAAAATLIFVAVFGCSVTVWGNFNFVTPYSHEATHGFLVCLALVLSLARWLGEPGARRAALPGLLFGLAAVLKPEILLAAGAATAAAVMASRLRPGTRLIPSALAWAAAAALPTLAFWAYFASRMPGLRALGCACRGWLAVVGRNRAVDPFLQESYLGLDKPGIHLLQHSLATVLAIALIAGLAAAARAMDRVGRRPAAILVGLSSAAACLWLALRWIAWADAGRCLLGLSILYLVWSWVSLAARARAGEEVSRDALRVLIAVLAAALMARMVLNGRINQFGFYQAALAGMLVPAVLVGELPDRLRLGPLGRATLVALSFILLGSGAGILAARSQVMLRQRTFAVGDGADRFYTMPPNIEATGALVNYFSTELIRRGAGQSLVVLPEGEMINYLARMPSPVAPFFFFSSATQGGRERAILDQLEAHPPDWILVISRDLREYGIERYGDAPGNGKLIVDWTRSRWHVEDSLGGDPLDYRQRGGVLLRPDPALH